MPSELEVEGGISAFGEPDVSLHSDAPAGEDGFEFVDVKRLPLETQRGTGIADGGCLRTFEAEGVEPQVAFAEETGLVEGAGEGKIDAENPFDGIDRWRVGGEEGEWAFLHFGGERNGFIK